MKGMLIAKASLETPWKKEVGWLLDQIQELIDEGYNSEAEELLDQVQEMRFKLGGQIDMAIEKGDQERFEILNEHDLWLQQRLDEIFP